MDGLTIINNLTFILKIDPCCTSAGRGRRRSPHTHIDRVRRERGDWQIESPAPR